MHKDCRIVVSSGISKFYSGCDLELGHCIIIGAGILCRFINTHLVSKLFGGCVCKFIGGCFIDTHRFGKFLSNCICKLFSSPFISPAFVLSLDISFRFCKSVSFFSRSVFRQCAHQHLNLR